MAYGTVKVDNITFDNGGSDQNVTVSGLYNSLTSGVSVTGTISGSVVIGSTSVSGTTVLGTTVTGTTVQGTNGTFTSLTGTTITGTTINGVTVAATTGSFTSLTGTTTSGTTANFVSGVFTTQVSGTTVTGTTSSFTSGNFTTLSGATATFTSGVLALGTATNPSLSFASDPNTGIYSPGADQVAVATNGTQRLTVDTAATTSTLPVVHPLGAVGTPSLTFTGDLNTGIWSPAADTIAFSEGGVEAMRIDSSARVGIGTSAPLLPLHVEATTDGPQTLAYLVNASTGGTNETAALAFGLKGTAGTGICRINAGKESDHSSSANTDTFLSFATTLNDTEGERLRITSAGNVGIGTTNPGARLGVEAPGTALVNLYDTTYAAELTIDSVTTNELRIRGGTSDSLAIHTGGSEKVRIDGSGRLLVGTSTARLVGQTTAGFQLAGGIDQSAASLTNYSNGTFGGRVNLSKSRGTSEGSFTVVQSGDELGSVVFCGADGSDLEARGAQISCEVDGTPGANDMPGRLVFSTTADGAASPTERMRIDSSGTHQLYGINDTLYSRTNRGAGTLYVTFAGVHSATSTTNGTASCYIYSNGNIQNTNGSYTTLSDAKLKENIVDAGSQWDDLKAIQIRNWNFKAETNHETHRQIGPIAQELETVCPGLVFETPDRDEDGNETGEVTKGVNQSVLYMKAVKALQEAMERIETLEASNTDLLARVSALESA